MVRLEVNIVIKKVRSDIIFANIFNNKECISALEEFIACIYNLKLKDVKGNLILHSRVPNLKNVNERKKEFDVLVEYENMIINIEANNTNVSKRNFAYLCHLANKHFNKRSDDIKKEIRQININFYKNNKEILETNFVRNEKSEIYYQNFRIDNINACNKDIVCYDKNEKIISFIKLLNASSKEELKKYVYEFFTKKTGKEVFDLIMTLEEEIDLFEGWEDYHRDPELVKAYQKTEKLEKELLDLKEKSKSQKQKVKSEVHQKVILNMIDRNLTVDMIVGMTGFSVDEVREIYEKKKKNKKLDSKAV